MLSNLVVSAVLVLGVGGLELTAGDITLTEIAVALLFGIVCNLIVDKSGKSDKRY